MYADDTNLTTSCTSLKDIVQSANADLSNIKHWLLANKLSLNVIKTEQLFIGSDDNLRKITNNIHTYINNNIIGRVSSSKTLGIVVDERLSWAAYTDYICKRVSSGIGRLRQIRDFITKETAITIYNSLIQPWFDYCDVAWDKLPATSAERLQKLQNRAARVITKQGYDIRSQDIRRSLDWDSLAERRYKHKAIMMFKIQNNDGSLNLTVTTRTTAEARTTVNGDLENVRQWLLANKLSLNLTKTEYILIASNHKILQLKNDQCINIGDMPVKRVYATKALGVYIDDKLTWSAQIDYIAKKISSALGGLRRARPFVPMDTLILIYQALIQPLFDYCDVVWEQINKGLTERLQKL